MIVFVQLPGRRIDRRYVSRKTTVPYPDGASEQNTRAIVGLCPVGGTCSLRLTYRRVGICAQGLIEHAFDAEAGSRMVTGGISHTLTEAGVPEQTSNCTRQVAGT